MRGLPVSVLAVGLLLAAGSPTAAQTTATGTTGSAAAKAVAHRVPPAKPIVAKHPAARHVVEKRVPVVAPRHAGPPRHAVVLTMKPGAGKPGAAKVGAGKPGAAKIRLAKRLPPKIVPPVVAPAKPAAAPPPGPPDVGSVTGLHLPRYASLKSDDVNMRVGPAERYPVAWTYKRRELPVKIEGEFDVWRKVEDMDGIEGWMHQATLTGRRTFVVTGTQDRVMRADADEAADAVAVLKPGVVGRIKSCDAGKDWCQVQVQDYRGWLKRAEIWGIDPEEVVAPS